MSAPKKQRKYYSGKKKRHTLKTQLLINPESEEVISLAFAKGKVGIANVAYTAAIFTTGKN